MSTKLLGKINSNELQTHNTTIKKIQIYEITSSGASELEQNDGGQFLKM